MDDVGVAVPESSEGDQGTNIDVETLEALNDIRTYLMEKKTQEESTKETSLEGVEVVDMQQIAQDISAIREIQNTQTGWIIWTICVGACLFVCMWIYSFFKRTF